MDGQQVSSGVDLFCLSKLLSFSGRDAGVAIELFVLGRSQDHEIIAVYLNNGALLLRYEGKDHIPFVKRLTWFKDPARSLAAIAFNPSARWLFCATKDCSVHLLPVHSLGPLHGRRASSKARSERGNGSEREKLPSLLSYASAYGSPPQVRRGLLGPTTDLSLGGSSRGKVGFATACAWWKTWGGVDYGIIGTSSGVLVLYNLQSLTEQQTVRFRVPIRSLSIVVDPAKSYKYALINGARGHSAWRLLLEQEGESGQYSLVVDKDNVGRPPFVPVEIARFSHELHVTAQCTPQGPMIGVHSPWACTMDMFDAVLSKFPLFVYSVPARCVHQVVTQKLIFASVDGRRGGGEEEEAGNVATELKVVSRLLSGTSSGRSGHFSRSHSVVGSILQSFSLPEGEVLRGIVASELHEEEGVLLWSDVSVYECRPKSAPDIVFSGLVAAGVDAESFALALGLDVLALYEDAADRLFEYGNLDRALELYRLSNVNPNKLASKFFEAGRMDIVLTHLRSVLADRTALDVRTNKKVAGLLFQCYLHVLLSKVSIRSAEAFEEEVRRFLVGEGEYQTDVALLSLLRFGLIGYFLEVAHARGIVPQALNMLIGHGIVRLDPQDVCFLQHHGYGELLRSSSDGVLFRFLPVEEQLALLLETADSIQEYGWRLLLLLPLLKEQDLLLIARSLCPDNESMAEIFRRNPPMSRDTVSSRRSYESSVPRAYGEDVDLSFAPHDVLELFLTCLLALESLRSVDAPRISPVVEEEMSDFADRGASKMFGDDCRVVQVAGGVCHSIVLRENGEIYACGRNEHGELGLGHTIAATRATRVPLPCKIAQISCGASHSAVVAENGDLYLWGQNNHGQLGMGTNQDELIPKLCGGLRSKRVLRCACGYYHSIVLTGSDEVYAWGHGEFGQIGNGGHVDVLSPLRIAALCGQRVSDLSAGYCHSAALTESGDVFVWGHAGYGQLGLARLSESTVSVPLQLSVSSEDGPFASLACGAFHTVLVAANAHVYVFGKAHKGRLGLGEAEADQTRPRLQQNLLGANVVAAACGHYHSLVLSGPSSMWWAVVAACVAAIVASLFILPVLRTSSHAIF